MIKNFGNLARTAALGAAVVAAAGLTATPGSAQAQHRGDHHWRGHHGGHGDHWHRHPHRHGDRWHQRHHHRHGHWHHRHHGWRGGDAAALGLLGGALAGAAIASAHPYYWHHYPYGYAYPYYYWY